MPNLINKLERLFKSLGNIEEQMSIRWRENVNRRTTLFILLAIVSATYLYVAGIQPPETFPVGTLVTVPEGASVAAIGETLYEQGVIRSPVTFRVLMTVFGRDRGARAGDYLFKKPENVWSIARAVAVGAFGLEPMRFRVPEGAMAKGMTTIFEGQLQRFNAQRFLAAATPQEGYLFPDTYFFLPNASESVVIQAMRQNFEDHLAKIQSEIASSTHSLSEIVTMASILEREAFNTQDRRMIAGVLWNRLSRGMALQVDATFLYTLGKGSFDLTMKDLTTDSPYNTYTNKGLPPTPIGSPGMDSIKAALHPVKSDYLYYLADHNGVTHYSRTYSEHLRKKKLYLGT